MKEISEDQAKEGMKRKYTFDELVEVLKYLAALPKQELNRLQAAVTLDVLKEMQEKMREDD